MEKKNVAIFVSGSGSNCENIIKYFANSDLLDIVLVLSNRADAYALTRAKKYNIPTCVMGKADFNDEQKIMPLLKEYNVDFIVLAGFLLMIPNFLVRAYHRRMINLHPALLPKFGGKGMYGMHVHEAVKQSGENETGITIHLIDGNYDKGNTVFQAKVAVEPTDSPDDIANKVHKLEYEYYPKVIEEIAKKIVAKK